MSLELVRLTDRPQLKEQAAQWFHQKWGVPLAAYQESMEQCLRRKAPVPQWYVVRDGGRLLAGAGVIANDFHDRKDLTPNLCALFVEPPWRGRGTAGRLLDFIRRDLGAMGIPRLYLVTDHTAFYERYGWTFLTMVTGDDHLPERMYTAPTLPPASSARVPPDTISP